MRFNRERKRKSQEKSAVKQLIFDWVIPIVAALIIAGLINKFVLFKVYIPSLSMYPTLDKGDQLFVTRVYNTDKIERGDILVFDSQELDQLLIKRVIGLPGDQVEIADGTLMVNGEVIEEDYVIYNQNISRLFQVPEGKYLFLGDNRANSNDSRYWDDPYIDGDSIEGKAQIRIYPFNKIGFID